MPCNFSFWIRLCTKMVLRCLSFLPEASFGLRVLSLPASVCVCPQNNSGPVQARITRFRAKMQNTLVKAPIVLGGN